MARKPPARASLDQFDRAILRILQTDNKTPQRAIAESVNLSTAAVQRRVAALEAAGVIAEVYLRDERSATVDAAKAAFRKTPEVQQCFYVTGGTSFVLVVVTRDMRSYETFTRKVFEDNDSVNNYRTLVVIDRVKTDTQIPIED